MICSFIKTTYLVLVFSFLKIFHNSTVVFFKRKLWIAVYVNFCWKNLTDIDYTLYLYVNIIINHKNYLDKHFQSFFHSILLSQHQFMQEILFTERSAYSFTPLLCENRRYWFMKYDVYFRKTNHFCLTKIYG